jgi:hypothetical protein
MRLKGDTDCVPDGASGPYVIRPVPIEEALAHCEYRGVIRRCLVGEVGSPNIFRIGDDDESR